MRRAHGLRAIEAARKALAVQTAAGDDPRASDRAGRKRGEANAAQHWRNRAWARGSVADRDAAWFLREIVPKLDGYSLSQIVRISVADRWRSWSPSRRSGNGDETRCVDSPSLLRIRHALMRLSAEGATASAHP